MSIVETETKGVKRINATTFWPLGAALAVGLLLLPILPTLSISMPGWLAAIGRLHPMLVHFPIVLAFLIGCLEVVSFFQPIPFITTLRKWFWTLAFGSALCSVLVGYLLFGSGDYAGELAQNHFWGGITTTIALGAVAILSFRESTTQKRAIEISRRIFIAVSLLGILYTGHRGGQLTHGASFLTEALPLGLPDIETLDKPQAEYLVFEDLITPILEQRCQSCHNESKTKGGLLLTSLRTIRNGGDSGKPILTGGNLYESELHQRLVLPPDDDDRMPPEGKSPLANEEIDLIAWWIEQGASEGMRYGDGPSDSTRSLSFDQLISKQVMTRRRQALKQEEAKLLAEELDATIKPLLIKTDPLTQHTTLSVSMKLPPDVVDDETIAALTSSTNQISSLSLVGSEISDDALFHIARIPTLQNLFLAYTRIDGSGLVYLAELPNLSQLNLSHTRLTNESALYLSKMQALEQVHVYSTKVDSTMVAALRSFMPDVSVSTEVGPFH